MKKLGAGVSGALLVAVCSMGTALADYTSSPSPTSTARGSGPGTAFTGGEVSAAVVVGLLLAALGACPHNGTVDR